MPGYLGGVESVHFPSGDAELVGVMYPAVGVGPRPTLLLLHGIPGSEKNVDISYRLREMGWHSLILHFKGAWGSGGLYDMTMHPDDAIAAIDYLLNTKADWEVEPTKLAVLGYSLGSRAALIAAHRDPRVKAVISIAGVADFDELMLSDDFYTGATAFLKAESPAQLSQQWSRLGGAENPISIIGGLTQPTLLIHGTQDEVIPYWMAPALHEASNKRADFVTIEGADHTYTQHRVQLLETVTGWLDKWTKQA
jgi:uncharacterized protein